MCDTFVCGANVQVIISLLEPCTLELCHMTTPLVQSFFIMTTFLWAEQQKPIYFLFENPVNLTTLLIRPFWGCVVGPGCFLDPASA